MEIQASFLGKYFILIISKKEQAAERIYANYINKLKKGDLVFGYDYNSKQSNHLIVVDNTLYVGPKNTEFSPLSTEFQKFAKLDEFVDEEPEVIAAVEIV